ncbi:MAG: SAF domain-containing protein, partial [Dehalococcoidia bacterium]
MLRGLSQPLSPFGGSSKMGLFLAVGLAILAGVIIFTALRSQQSGGRTSAGAGGSLGVVTATQDIPAGVQITPGMVERSPLAEDSVLPFALGQPELAVGQYARIPILAGEQVVGTKLATA